MFGLKLTDNDRAKRDAILAEKGHDLLADIEETCEGSRSYHYEVHPSGIGDTIFLVYKNERHDITDFENW